MKLHISKRLQLIIDMCEPCDTIVDVGTDHGKVAISLANLKISNTVIAIDNKIGPINTCKENAKMYLNDDSAKLLIEQSSGIETLNKTTEYGIIITGIGYDNMREIISNINEYNFKYLILSPHTKITELIKYIEEKNMDVTEQKNIYEADKYYYIIKVKKRGE